MSDNETIYWQAIEELRSDLPRLLLSEEAQLLDEAIRQLVQQRDDPNTSAQALDQALDLLRAYPVAQQQLQSILDEFGLIATTRIFNVVPGGPSPIRPGTLLVCPIDPAHYQLVLRMDGQSFCCPEHEVKLVPKTSRLSEEG